MWVKVLAPCRHCFSYGTGLQFSSSAAGHSGVQVQQCSTLQCCAAAIWSQHRQLEMGCMSLWEVCSYLSCLQSKSQNTLHAQQQAQGVPPGTLQVTGALLLLSACKLELSRGAAVTKIADIPPFFLAWLVQWYLMHVPPLPVWDCPSDLQEEIPPLCRAEISWPWPKATHFHHPVVDTLS